MTSQLLAFSRRQQLQPITLCVQQLIIGIEDLVRRAVGEAVTVEIAADPDLRLDPARFESAILNLAVNARDVMAAGGRLVIAARNVAVRGLEAVRLDVAPGEYVRVAVTDSGAGMAPDVLRRAFEPFFTTKDIGKGTGLGLAQVYGFAKQSGGTATIDSAREKGHDGGVVSAASRCRNRRGATPGKRTRRGVRSGEDHPRGRGPARAFAAHQDVSTASTIAS